MSKVLVIEDHAIVRHGIIRILEESNKLDVDCDEASTSREVFMALAKCQYQALLLDISLNDENGFDLLPQIRRMQSSLPILIVSIHPEETHAARALKLGAAGYLEKSSSPDTMIEAVCNVLSGRRYISNSLASGLADRLADNQRMPLPAHENLSPRELQILRKIGNGKTPTEISENLCLSVKTISTYRTRILDKMKMQSTAELMKYAITHKLVD